MAIKDLGDNVRRLMKLQELTIPALAALVEMGTASISNILNGKTEPKSSTLISLANALKVPIQDLLADTPKLRSLRFRTARTLSAREKAERDQVRHLTAKWIEDYRFLEQSLQAEPPYQFAEIPNGSPRAAARAIRNELGLGLEPIHDIVQLVTDAGIKLRLAPFGFKKTFGLSLGKEDGGPAIVVNTQEGISVERQIFTIAHELGHLILHLDSFGTNEDIEVEKQEDEANLFAGQLLLPDDALVKDWVATRGMFWVDAVLKLKKKYRVSYMTVLTRLRQTVIESPENLIIQFRFAYKQRYGHDLKDFYEPNAIEGPVARKEEDGLSPSDLAGDRFSCLVIEAYEKGVISLGRGAEMLGCSIDEIRALLKGWQEL